MSELTALLDLVADDMQYVEDKMRSGVSEKYEDLQAVIDYLMDAGGKRLRPVVTLMAAQFYPVEMDKAHSLAGAIELLHTATLVHDDLIDNSLFRRGVPTLNASWSPAATILTGDYLFARAAGLATETGSVRVVAAFSDALMTIVGGELQQLFNDGHGNVPSMEEYTQRIYAKTASLFATGTVCGGILSEASEAEVQALYDYGYHFGMAFQVMDDILDFRGDEDRIGKPAGNDLRQGIATLPVIYYNEVTPNDPIVMKAVRREGVSDDEIAEIVSKIRASGFVDKAHEEAKRYARQAQADLEILPEHTFRDALSQIADYAVNRDV